jgi:hypothetical protein
MREIDLLCHLMAEAFREPGIVASNGGLAGRDALVRVPIRRSAENRMRLAEPPKPFDRLRNS